MTTLLYTGPITTNFNYPLRYIAVDAGGNIANEVILNFTQNYPLTVNFSAAPITFDQDFAGWSFAGTINYNITIGSFTGLQLNNATISKTVTCSAGNIEIHYNSQNGAPAVYITGSQTINTTLPYTGSDSLAHIKTIPVTGGTYNISIGQASWLLIGSIVFPGIAQLETGLLTGNRPRDTYIEGVSGASFGSDAYPTSTTWSMEVSGLVPGVNTITVRAMDGETEVGTASMDVVNAFQTAVTVAGMTAQMSLTGGIPTARVAKTVVAITAGTSMSAGLPTVIVGLPAIATTVVAITAGTSMSAGLPVITKATVVAGVGVSLSISALIPTAIAIALTAIPPTIELSLSCGIPSVAIIRASSGNVIRAPSGNIFVGIWDGTQLQPVTIIYL